MPILRVAILVCGLLLCVGRAALAGDDGLARKIIVPLDYADPKSGTAELTYEFGARFDPKKPTVIIVADGQQFFVKPGAAATLQAQLFGPNVNVVGLITRGTTPAFIDAAVGP